mmetsp:Transcript_7720/g.9562  ORF Transcript_7720/g.9562 Transcript_7720/m.9562 type:complete len:287 (-) Transcript_7720:58-918(-)
MFLVPRRYIWRGLQPKVSFHTTCYMPTMKDSPVYRYIAERSCFQSGGTARIYRAKHMETEQIVAIKVIPFTSEQTYATIQMQEHFVFQNQGYIVMELKHMDLFSRCATFSSIEEVKHIFRQICIGTKELHQKQISHLDLKMENILLDTKDTVSICDFGTSYHWTQSDRFDRLVGSEFYLAPELFVHDLGYSSVQADIWSLGILLSVLITGRYPYDGESDEEIYENYFCANVSLKEIEIFLPGDTECLDLLSKMLSKRPEDRLCLEKIISHPWLTEIQNETEIVISR